MNYKYKPQGVCPIEISFDINGDKVTNIKFLGGCPGNLKAISKLLDGKSVEYIETMLKGNTCGMKNTSCANELAKAVKDAYDKNKK